LFDGESLQLLLSSLLALFPGHSLLAGTDYKKHKITAYHSSIHTNPGFVARPSSESLPELYLVSIDLLLSPSC
jgi:hypothetical protein